MRYLHPGMGWFFWPSFISAGLLTLLWLGLLGLLIWGIVRLFSARPRAGTQAGTPCNPTAQRLVPAPQRWRLSASATLAVKLMRPPSSRCWSGCRPPFPATPTVGALPFDVTRIICQTWSAWKRRFRA